MRMRGLLRGVHAYLREHREWSIHLPEQARGAEPPEWLARWRGDGIIARIENRPIAHAIRAKRLPTVDVSASRLLPKLPCVETDNEAIARLALDHLAIAASMTSPIAATTNSNGRESEARRSPGWPPKPVAGWPSSRRPKTGAKGRARRKRSNAN